jgi:phosphohistidine swiveling domain-containing protein
MEIGWRWMQREELLKKYNMLKRDEYFKTVRRPYASFFVSLIMEGSAKPEYYKTVIDEPFSIQNLCHVEGWWWYPKKEAQEGSRIAFTEWMDPKKCANARRVFEKQEKVLLATAKGTDFKTFCREYEAYMPALILVWRTEDLVESHIRSLLLKKFSSDETEELMHKLNIPLDDNYHNIEALALVQTKDIVAHVKEFEFFKSRFGKIDPYTVQDAQVKREKLLEENFLQKHKEEKKIVRKVVKQVKDALGPDAHIVDLMQFVVYYRTQRTDVMNRSHYLFAPGFKKLAKEHGVSYEQLVHATKGEILGTMPPVEELNARIDEYAVIQEFGKVRCVSGTELGDIQEFFHEDVDDVAEFKGNIASPGKAVGTAKIIFGTDDFDKVEEGDILVTPMTNPHMMPIMRKASAFITDEGGITCHAAILSREMKKPCIIGTKIATQVLKDGDKVEVDTEKGMVRKI